jgi:S-adenosylmethionine synthetase
MAVPSTTIRHRDRAPLATGGTAFVERKGVGHPGTLCDGIDEAISRRLSRYYREEFDRILHHNTDEVQLVAAELADLESPTDDLVAGERAAF